MKKNYELMNSKAVKEFISEIEKQYGKAPTNIKDCAYIRGKDKIYKISRDVDKIDIGKLRINNLGLYIAELRNGQLRLSIEGSQYLGPAATKNICEIDKEQLTEWLAGEDLEIEGDYGGFVILKYKKDFVGSGKYSKGKVFNYIPKARRVKELH